MKIAVLPSVQSNGAHSRSAYDRLYRNGEKIRPLNLDRLRYRLTARYVIAAGDYKIFELLPLDSAREAEVSFLTRDIKVDGVIIPHAYHEHKARLKSSIPGSGIKKKYVSLGPVIAPENAQSPDFSVT